MTHDLRLNIEVMDAAHETFLQMLEQLQKMEGGAIDTALFREWITETKRHFAEEEKLMMKHLYSERETHTGDHEQLVDEMESFFTMITSMPPMARSFIESYAYDKFRRHTMFYDLDLAKFLSGNEAG
ncbi:MULTISPECIES: hemerythrin family protein [Sulfurimonas]|uniref:Hemerythrin family protein n=1 Tax=Sulfurimonas diazotrophicus TaxID=3131939 RepID=A0ABZ3HBN7_9BACT